MSTPARPHSRAAPFEPSRQHLDAAWALTEVISPRSSVRVAAVDASTGQPINVFSGRVLTSASCPQVPWAVNLTTPDRQFVLLAFDFDAKGDPARAAGDAARLVELLDQVGVAHVVCASGPGGGRHVWTRLTDPVTADLAVSLARLLRHVCPSLDITPLMNPATGCMRPPGAPHRDGGVSEVLSGDLATLRVASTTPAQVQALLEALIDLVGGEQAGPVRVGTGPLPLDEQGHRHLPGTRRDLPAVSAAALTAPADGEDASAVLWRVLIGAAGARWRHRDLAALVAAEPGMEHVRTRAGASGRQPRPVQGPGGQRAVLARQWDKAVAFVATSARSAGEDPTFAPRAQAITDHVHAVQRRADTSGGRWSRGGGPADRRVLDALCALALHALRPDVEADVRRLSQITGIARETARTALHRLAADGWITQTRSAEGPHAAHWSIDPHSHIPSDTGTARSQAVPRPCGSAPAERTAALAELRGRLSAAAHDLFTPGAGLGFLAGNLWARLPTPQTTLDLSAATGLSRELTEQVMHRLAAAGVVTVSAGGWARRDRRDIMAVERRLAGRLLEREVRYGRERVVWAWWRAELTWMSAPSRPASCRRPGTGQLTLLAEAGGHPWPPFPRSNDGRADHRAARISLEVPLTVRVRGRAA